jgi:peroxiredoxin
MIKYHMRIITIAFLLLIMTGTASAIPPAPWEIEGLMDKKAPALTLPDLNGKSISIKSFRGILLNFWATWCAPCKREMPALDKIYNRYKKRGFRVIAVSIDNDKSAIEGFLGKIPLSFTILHDKKIQAAKSYKVYAYPTTFLIDRNGIIREKFIGEEDWLDASRTKLIERLLDEKYKKQ